MSGFPRHLMTPYGLALALIVILVAYGFATNNGFVGMTLGAGAAVALDPISIVVALIIGATCRQWWLAAVACAVAAVAMHLLLVMIDELGLGGPPAYLIPARFLGLFLWAGVASAIRAFKDRQKPVPALRH